MTYMEILFPGAGSRISGTFHMSMESPYLPHLTNLTYIEKENYFLWNNFITAGLRPENWRRLTDANYTSNPSPLSDISNGHGT